MRAAVGSSMSSYAYAQKPNKWNRILGGSVGLSSHPTTHRMSIQPPLHWLSQPILYNVFKTTENIMSDDRRIYTHTNEIFILVGAPQILA